MTGIQKTTTNLVLNSYLKERQQQILTLTAVLRCQQTYDNYPNVNNKSIIACMKRTTAPQQYLFDWVNMATNNMAIPNREKQNAKLICDSYP